MYEYDLTLPVSGKVIKWGSAKAQNAFDLTPVYSQPSNKHLLDVALACARVTEFDGKPREQIQPDMMVQVRGWDELDLEAFLIAVQERDDERRKALKIKTAPSSETMITARQGVLEAMGNLAQAIRLLVDMSTALEASRSPLGTT